MASELKDLVIKEVSGVDDPANEAPGWMVAKSREIPELDAVDTEADEAKSTLAKLKEILLGKSEGTHEQEDEVEMTKEELNKELDERFETLKSALTESVTATFAELAKTLQPEPEIPAEPEVTEPVAEVTEPAIDEDAIAKSIETGVTTALEPVLEIMNAVIERVERTEDMLSIRKSLDGQEGGDAPATPAKPTLNDAFSAALRGQTVELR